MDKKELELLKEEADKLGMKYSANIGLESLKKKIEEFKEETSEEKVAEKAEVDTFKEMSALVRVMVTPLCSSKLKLNGEIFTIQNSLGKIRKFVPYNLEAGYHIPKALFNMLKAKERTVFYDTKDAAGNIVRRAKFGKAFSIVELEPLTQAELDELADDQRVRNGIG